MFRYDDNESLLQCVDVKCIWKLVEGI